MMSIRTFVLSTATLLMLTGTAMQAASSSAVYLKEDTTTQGAWNQNYGRDGYMIPNGPTSGPAFATSSVSGGFAYTWANQTSDVRALQITPGAALRAAAAYTNYQSSTFNININTTNGAPQMVAFYLLDWDSSSRSETLTIRDASTNVVLDQRTFTNFHNGSYEVYNLAGNLTITVTPGNYLSPAVSGVFFGPGGSAPSTVTALATVAYQGIDSTTQGNWNKSYGANGYMIPNGASSAPLNGVASVTGAFNYTWAGWTLDPRALQTSPGSTTRAASCYTQYQSKSFNINVNTSTNELVALYMLDWDLTARVQTVTITDASTNAVLDRRDYAAFQDGKYGVYMIKGNVVITVSAAYGIIPAVSGVFFGYGGSLPVVNKTNSSAAYKGIDTFTQGAWGGKYGANGYMIANGGSVAPRYATADVSGAMTWTWANLTADPRALQITAGSAGRMASLYTQYSSKSFQIHVNINDGGTHTVAFYLLGWDTPGRSQTMTITDLSTGTLLDSRTLSGFNDGVWALWDIKGNVVITVTPSDWQTPAVSGVFFN